MHSILTPSGYRDASSLQFGDEVCAFDMHTGAPIVNTLESKPQWVDATKWARWHSTADEVPPFRFYRINGTWTLNSEQSIWRNGLCVCHARNLMVGDVIYDDTNNDVAITSIEAVNADGWWRLDVSGDSSYVIDGLTVHNASRFWVGGTGSLDGSDTTHISATSGGAGGATYPTSADTMTWDASSGGGTTTVAAAHTLHSVIMGAFGGTWDNSVGNHNFTLNGSGSSTFSGTGTGVRTIKLGTATYTLTSSGATWTINNTTNLTFTGNTSAVITFTGGLINNDTRSFLGGGLTYGTLNIGASLDDGYCNMTGSNTFQNLNIDAPNYVIISGSAITTIVNAFNWVGVMGSPIAIVSSAPENQTDFIVHANSVGEWISLRGTNWTGAPVVTFSSDLGNNSGITIHPGAGGTGAHFSAAIFG